MSGVSVIPSSHAKPAEKKGLAALAPAPASGEHGEVRVQAALAASNRTEASLSSLMRVVQTLSAGVSGARESNVELVRELEMLRDMLGRANEHQLGLKNRLKALESALEEAQREAARERAFLADQHDAFLAGLIEDHERVVAKLREELDDAHRRLAERSSLSRLEPAAGGEPSLAQMREQLEAAQRGIEKLVGERERTREALLRLQAQRDEAQATVVRMTRERDQARAEMGQLKIQQGMTEAMREATHSERPSSSPVASSRPPTPNLTALKPTVRPAATASNPNAPTVRPMAGPLASAAATRSTAPMAPQAAAAGPAAPPLDFKAPLPLAPVSEKPSSGPPLKAKPDPSTRPLVGYSMTEASEERVDTSRITSPTRPPNR